MGSSRTRRRDERRDKLRSNQFPLLFLSAFLLLAFSPLTRASVEPVRRLPQLGIDPSRVTVSGVSSGGFMAVQLHIAHSKVFSGMASVAGGIYWCAEGREQKSFLCMTLPSRIDSNRQIVWAREEARRGNIDPVEELQKSRVFLYGSPSDTVVKIEGLGKLNEFYEEFLPQSRIRIKSDFKAAHGFPTLDYGIECLKVGIPWLLNCNYDLAGEVLSNLSNKVLKPRTQALRENLSSFDQTEFAPENALMHDWGGLYVPKACRSKESKCALHVALHGCQMNSDFIQKQFIENAGYNEWAESNGTVVLYPQAAKSELNKNGCWDWFGYTGPDYANQHGPQIKAVVAMVKRLVSTP